MCYTHDDSIPILGERWVQRARKEHRCDECGGRIRPGESYNYAFGADAGDGVVWKICEPCHIHAAFIYAIERGEGCEPWESRPPLGAGYLSEDLTDRGLSLCDQMPDDNWADGDRTNYVVRWHHIDDARAGKLEDAPFTQEVARRLGISGTG